MSRNHGRERRGPLGRGLIWARDYCYAIGVRFRRVVVRVDPVTLEQGPRRAVLLIPGVYETWDFLLPIARALNRAGHPVFVVPGLGRNLAPIPEAAVLAARLLGDRDVRNVVIVAHSKGGLIGKHVMALDDPDGRVAGLVAIATPFHGSSLSRFTLSRPLREFVPGRGSIAALAAELHVNESITSIYPEVDPHIPGGSELPGATNVPLPLHGHFRVLGDPRVIREVLRAVEELPAR